MSLLRKPAFRNRSRIFRSQPNTVSACREIESLVGSAFQVPLNDLRVAATAPRLPMPAGGSRTAATI
jgi:hypothetical protein